MKVFRRRPARGAGPPAGDLPARFGRTCPVCGSPLGVAPPLDPQTGRFVVPPCFRLEVGPSTGVSGAAKSYPWRLSIVGSTYRPAKSTEPAFNTHEVDYVYLLCGDGHIFPDSQPLIDATDPQHIDVWNVAAALGAPASGKTYLLLRMLNQSLDNPMNWTADNDADRVRQYQLSPLEQLPLQGRSNMYAQMLATGEVIEPTTTDRRGRPRGILSEELPEALEAIMEMIRLTVVDGERRAESWGARFRQPLVLRTRARRHRAWTGVADLPGELFDPDDLAPRERVKLRDYDSLIWVVDPVVAAGPLDRFAEDSLSSGVSSYENVLDGSLRPGTTQMGDAAVVRANRDHIQTEIGRQLTLVDGPYTSEQGAALQMLIAVTKCDLIHAALRQRDLDKLGEPGEVFRGVGGYLALLARRFGEQTVDADEGAASLLHYLYAGTSAEQSVRDQRVYQVAEGLLRHYSAPAAFWSLVHTGEAERIDIAAVDMVCPSQSLYIPAIGTHLDHALTHRGGHRLAVRDVVMSAVGCGVAYGLGHEETLFKIIRDPGRHVRFFLCSPLGTVPRATDTGGRLQPLATGDRFPRVQDRSAGLTQLLLSVLGKARA